MVSSIQKEKAELFLKFHQPGNFGSVKFLGYRKFKINRSMWL